jgi:hypothetical protein
MGDTTSGEDLSLKVITSFFGTELGETDGGRLAVVGLIWKEVTVNEL